MRIRWILIAILAFIAPALRLYPTIALGEPFSTDGWPLIRGVEAIIERSPVDLGDPGFLDGYNNYWPGSMIFGALGSLITGIDPVDFMRIYIPLSGSMGILVFLAIALRLIGNNVGSILSTLILSLAATHSIFTAGVTKETFANPLYMALILSSITPRGFGGYICMAILSAALVISHHLASLATLAILVSSSILNIIYSIRIGSIVRPLFIPAALVLMIAMSIYYPLYAYRGFKQPIEVRDLVEISSYMITTIAIASIAYPAGGGRYGVEGVLTALIYTAILSTLLIAMRKPIAPGLPVVGFQHILYGASMLILPFLAMMSRHYARDHTRFSAIAGWLSAASAIMLYSIFGSNPVGSALAYRSLNFVIPALSMMASISMSHYIEKRARVGIAILVILIISLAFSPLAIYNTVERAEPLTSHWAYDPRETAGASYLASYCVCKSVGGDVKVLYLMQYYGLSVDVAGALRYIAGSSGYGGYLYVYAHMYVNGFMAGLTPIRISQEGIGRIYLGGSIYSNGYVDIAIGVP